MSLNLYFLNVQVFFFADSISDEDNKKHELKESLEKYIVNEDLWSCFEEALGELDYDQLKEDNSDYLIGPGDDNWRDSANHDYQYMIQEALKFTNDIDYQFKRWIGMLNTKVRPLQSIINILNECVPPTVFLSFNYTDTLENTYNINRKNILYIHGKAKEDSKLILGHHDDSYWTKNIIDISTMTEEEIEEYYEYMQERDFREVEADNIIEEYFRITYKDTESIINKQKHFFKKLNKCSKVYILGHSLSDIDFKYFAEIQRRVLTNCEWIISIYSNEDKCRVKNFIQTLRIDRYKIIQI